MNDEIEPYIIKTRDKITSEEKVTSISKDLKYPIGNKSRRSDYIGASSKEQVSKGAEEIGLEEKKS